MKKRVLSLLMAFVMVISLLPATTRAAENITVLMTVYNAGQLVKDKNDKAMLLREVSVADLNGDGTYTLDEAIRAAHAEYYSGGMGGYATDYGYVSKLWGENASNSGFCKNDAMTGLVGEEPVADGDRLTVYIYHDTVNYSDRYSFFDAERKTVAANEEFTLTLTGRGYDETWVLVENPVATAPLGVFDPETGSYSVPDSMKGAVVWNDVRQKASTGYDGKAVVLFTEPGVYYVTAQAASSGYVGYDDQGNSIPNYLVPPLCIVTVLSAEDYARWQVVQSAKGQLRWETIGGGQAQEAVTSALTLRSTLNVEGKPVNVYWTSSDTSVLSVSSYNGQTSAWVDRPAAQPAGVRLTASLVYETVRDTKVFPLTVKAEGVNDTKEPVVNFKSLMDGIAAARSTSTDAWMVLDMAGYGRDVKAGDYGWSSPVAKTLAEAAIGGDTSALINELKTFNVNGPSAIYTTPYVLLAYDAVGAVEDETFTCTRAAMKEAMIAFLNDLDSNYAGVDDMAPLLAALAPYYEKGDAALDAAVRTGIAWLSAQQNDDGTYSYYGTQNANSTAMVIVSLSALGIDAHRDSRFIKNGHSAVEGLMSFALNNHSGFGYKGNVTENALATEQGLRALVSYARFAESGGQPYNIYLQAEAGKAAPADPKIAATVKPQPIAPEDETVTTITVTVKVCGDTGIWLNKNVSARSGASVYDVLTSVLASSGYTWEGSSNYISYITNPSGVRLGEFSTGPNSGWLYKVNGILPSTPLGEYILKSNASIVFYYTNDWTLDPDAGSMADAKTPDSPSLTPVVTVRDGAASASVSSEELNAALGAAAKSGGDTVTIAPQVKDGADRLAVTLPAAAAMAAAKQGVCLVVESGKAQVSLSAEVLNALAKNSGSEWKLEIAAKQTEDIRDDLAGEALDGASIVEVTLTVGGEPVTAFGGEKLLIDIPVDKKHFRDGDACRVLILSGDGTVERTRGRCVEKDGALTVTVETAHLSTFVVARAAAMSFSDVADTAWYADAVKYAYENGLMTGVSESEFAPDGTATRAQIVTILWRLAGSPAVNYALRYADADEGAWYGEAVRWAASTGIVTGYTESSFGPNDAITREQLAAILYRYGKAQGQGFTGMWYFPLRYDDAPRISSWADEAMHWCVMKGILNGTSGTTLSPKDAATRAQLAVILRRFCELPRDTASKSAAQTAYDGVSAYLTAAVSAPRYGSLGGEWTVLALARGGADTETAYFTDYYAALEQTVREANGVLSERKYTEYSRVILALSALGKDARDVAGFDLTLPLGDYEKTAAQGVNGVIYALLALDSRDYPMPQNAAASTQATRQLYVDAILAAQLANGGWSFMGEDADPDLTSMALQALAKYREQSSVRPAVDRALVCLSAMQNADGGFSSWGSENAESCAQVLLALNALGLDADDSRFVKNGHSVLDALLTYQNADGGFCHERGGETNLMASEQAVCALASLVRAERGESGLYRMAALTQPAA